MKTISSCSDLPVNSQKNNYLLVESEQKPEKIFVTSRQLSEMIGMPVYTIRQKAREGVFPVYGVTEKGYLFKVAEIVKIIEGTKIKLKSGGNVVKMQEQRCNDLPGGKGGQ
ncbi:MAG: hypothetical protein KA369_05640 [Spirochaetes bacterium]|nr:hypothetical protein [Spirochaetota bacterium]